MFYERGYSDATVQDIADALGILKGSLYHYIETKEDLLFRLLERSTTTSRGSSKRSPRWRGLTPLERLALYVRRRSSTT